MAHQFTKGQVVSFTRNSIVKSAGTPVVSLCPIREGDTSSPTYIIENENGWVPNQMRKTEFVLDETKKYLFVQEKELTLVE
jgi:hypothetical protein